MSYHKFCVEVREGVFELFDDKESSCDCISEMLDQRGYSKEQWCDAYDEVYVEWVDRCPSCESGYVMPDGRCNECSFEEN